MRDFKHPSTVERVRSANGSSPARNAGSRRSTARPRPPLVETANFLLATRDTGYRGTPQAVAELIDNSIQAGATSVRVSVLKTPDQSHPIEILVVDNGEGMDASALAASLTFGGSTRFGNRSSLGRYGMGLPNGGLSRARRIEVYTWQDDVVLSHCLDLDELVSCELASLPPVERTSRPFFSLDTPHGTAVLLTRCDRLEYRRASTLANKLRQELGRIYLRFLENGFRLLVNDDPVSPSDPLKLGRNGGESGAASFGETLHYQLSTSHGEGSISVNFTELPVERWHMWSVEEKRRAGVTGSANVFIVRAKREIDQGWFFMGEKRRENYDDWWRCEISFDPGLDELFGITHAKQSITPHPDLQELLGKDLEPIARALNSRVRQKFEAIKSGDLVRDAERQAGRADQSLPPLVGRYGDLAGYEIHARTRPADAYDREPYQVVVGELSSTAAFEVVVRSGRLLLVLNSSHPLYRDLIRPLLSSGVQIDQNRGGKLVLLLLAAGRAEAMTPPGSRSRIQQFRQLWADITATYLNAGP